jgi:hypothetical protein
VSNQNAASDLLEVVKRNGDFRKNYGMVIGGYLYVRSIRAACGRSVWRGLFFAAVAAGLCCCTDMASFLIYYDLIEAAGPNATLLGSRPFAHPMLWNGGY